MFKKGDCVIHTLHGAGVLLGIKKMSVSGREQRYYHIDLLANETMLMIPVDKAKEVNPCPMIDMVTIAAIFHDDPEELDRNYRERQSYITDKIHSGDPQQAIEALRDLLWRKHTAHLSIEDTKLMTQARRLVASILALQPDVTMKKASWHLDEFLQQTMQDWKIAIN